MNSEAPKDLTALEYARHILECELGWPARGNLEMMADCITSVSKSRNISLVKAHSYMHRAITLAKKQGVTLDKWFFQEGGYTTIRPEPKSVLPRYVPIDQKRTAEEQATPEFKHLRRQFEELLGRIKAGSQIK